MSIAEAIKTLRLHVGLSQQRFATGCGFSIAALQTYEGGKTPGLRALTLLYQAAVRARRQDLATAFDEHIRSVAGLKGIKLDVIFPPLTPMEEAAVPVFLHFLRGAMAPDASPELKERAVNMLCAIGVSPLDIPAELAQEQKR